LCSAGADSNTVYHLPEIFNGADPLTTGPTIDSVLVPDAIAVYVVETRASDYDHLLLTDGAVDE
jgi:hypothetical protein